MQNEKITAYTALVKKSFEAATISSIVFHSPLSGEVLKIKGVPVQISGERRLQMESSLTEGRVVQHNLTADMIDGYIEKCFDTFGKSDLNDRNGTAALYISKKGAVSLIKKGEIGKTDERLTNASEIIALPLRKNDREKNRLLTGNEAFLTYLGISDERGRVHDKKQSKFRQICRFSEYIKEAEKKLKRKGTLYVCDLCCGKSYLSFAAYHVLTSVLGRDVKMVCVDMKKSVMDECREIALKAGMRGMEFLTMNISDFTPDLRPDLVVSLHACDTATDVVLDFAAKYGAEIILSTPCCHRQMAAEMNCPTLDFIAQSPILKQKLATAATDALRLLKLESDGYKTDATELIDPDDTPKNVMLRAVKRKKFSPSEAEEKREKYRAAYFLMYGKYPD